MKIGEEVIDSLCQNSGPVDGVDCAEVMLLVERSVGEKSFDDVLVDENQCSDSDGCMDFACLTIVKRSLDGNIVNV